MKAGVEVAACALAAAWDAGNVLVSVVDHDAETEFVDAVCRLVSDRKDPE
jgi:hypothetical protein